jgi:hypothetical protein
MVDFNGHELANTLLSMDKFKLGVLNCPQSQFVYLLKVLNKMNYRLDELLAEKAHGL